MNIGWLSYLAALSSQLPSIGILVVADETLVRRRLVEERVHTSVLENTRLPVQLFEPGRLSAPLMKVRAGCAGEGSCFAQRLAPFVSTDLLLMVSMIELGDTYSLSVRLLDLKSTASLGRSFGEFRGSESTETGVVELIRKVIPPRWWGPLATMTVLTEPPGIELEIGEDVCLSPCTRARLPPGPIQVTGRWEDRVVGRVDLRLEAGEATTVRLPVTLPDSKAWYENPWLWTGVGVVIVAAGVATFFAVQGGPDTRPACLSFRPEMCP